jgi:hypothetical protein
VTRCLYVALVILFGAAVYTERAGAHLVEKPKAPGLEARLVSQQANLAHARFVCNRGANANRRWHCVWVPILERELAKTRYAILVRQRRARAEAAHNPSGVRGIICQVFGRECAGAIRVAHCETGGTFNPRIVSSNGLYFGIFQQGAYSRSRYGFGWDAWSQARAAKRHRDAEGWGPWPHCSRVAGLR